MAHDELLEQVARSKLKDNDFCIVRNGEYFLSGRITIAPDGYSLWLRTTDFFTEIENHMRIICHIPAVNLKVNE
jgi:hypothetical protein